MHAATNTKARIPVERPKAQSLPGKATFDAVAASAPRARPARPARINVDPSHNGRSRPAHDSPRDASQVHGASSTDRAATKCSTASGPKQPRFRQRGSSVASKPKRPSALDAASTVLAALKGAEAKAGIAAPDLIERMQKAKLWTSPGGRTPAATLYAGMIREAKAKGSASRFRRASPGRFVAGPAAKSRAKVTA